MVCNTRFFCSCLNDALRRPFVLKIWLFIRKNGHFSTIRYIKFADLVFFTNFARSYTHRKVLLSKCIIIKPMSVNYHKSPFMNRCRLLAMLLMLALALPMIGQTTYTYIKSKGKSLRDLQTNSLGGYQKQAAHEDRVVIYRQPSTDPFTLWRNAEGFVSYARWYDYTNDKSIPISHYGEAAMVIKTTIPIPAALRMIRIKRIIMA